MCACMPMVFFLFFFNDTATTEIYTLSLHDALPIFCGDPRWSCLFRGRYFLRRSGSSHSIGWERRPGGTSWRKMSERSEEHTSELQSHLNLVCRLLLEKKKKISPYHHNNTPHYHPLF